MGNLRADHGIGQCLAPLFAAHLVQYADQVRGGIEQRAVEVEQHGTDGTVDQLQASMELEGCQASAGARCAM
jgi:hypothetical protein